MSNLILPSEWTRQPQYPVEIDWSNPITRRLLDAWLPHQLSTSSVNRRRPLTNQRVELISGSYGIGAAATAGSVRYDVGPYGESGTFSFLTIVSVFNFNILASVVRRDGAVTPAQIYNNTIRGVPWAPGLAGQNYYNTPAAPKHAIIVSNRVSQSTQDLYAAGALVSTTSSLTGYGSTANPLCFLGTETNAELFTPSVGLFFGGIAWNRALSADEIKSLSNNPWQIFKAQSRRIFVASAGGGGATVNGLFFGGNF